MNIVAIYDFNGGKTAIQDRYATEFEQIQNVIHAIDANTHKTKKSTEKTMMGKLPFSPVKLNKAFKREFSRPANGAWANCKIACEYVYGEYQPGYVKPHNMRGKPFRDMDFVKPGAKLGLEVQFGKYAFMVYNVCAKMTIFSTMGIINAGIEIVPVKNFADEMSTGVSYFEQFAWDLEYRGVSNIDIPVLILGIDV